MASGEHQAQPVQPDYRPIHDYGIVGNSQSAASVATDGSIDWFAYQHAGDAHPLSVEGHVWE